MRATRVDKTNPDENRTLCSVWGALLVLTALTVWVAGMGLGFLSILAALSIATAKAALVVLFFMDLRRESGLIHHMLLLALLVLGIFLGFTFFDVGYRY